MLSRPAGARAERRRAAPNVQRGLASTLPSGGAVRAQEPARWSQPVGTVRRCCARSPRSCSPRRVRAAAAAASRCAQRVRARSGGRRRHRHRRCRRARGAVRVHGGGPGARRARQVPAPSRRARVARVRDGPRPRRRDRRRGHLGADDRGASPRALGSTRPRCSRRRWRGHWIDRAHRSCAESGPGTRPGTRAPSASARLNSRCGHRRGSPVVGCCSWTTSSPPARRCGRPPVRSARPARPRSWGRRPPVGHDGRRRYPGPREAAA